MKSDVLNNSFGSPYEFTYPNLTTEQQINIIAGLFEQLMIFDKVTVTVSRLNFPLYFLLRTLGMNTVERLIDAHYVRFILWSPLIITGAGTQLEDGTIDRNSIIGRPPLLCGSFIKSDLDPEKNVTQVLRTLGFHKDRIKSFTKKATKEYIIPDGSAFSSEAAEFVIDAYKHNNLENLGLPYIKEPDQLDVNERLALLDLSSKVVESAILAEYRLKSYENFEAFEICKKNMENIGKAYQIADNTATLFKLENLPNLKQLFIYERLPFDSIFQLRHLSVAKYFRSWINEVGEDKNQIEITAEYLNEIKGKHKFINTTSGKFLKHLTLLGVGALVGQVASAQGGEIIGGIAGEALSLLDDLWLDNILAGKNPSMFIDYLKNEVNPPGLENK